MRKYHKYLFILIVFLSFIPIILADNANDLGDLSSPPRLRSLEPILVQIVYMIWAFGGLIFTVLLMVIGFQYMISMGDPQKQEELKSRGKNWIIGLIIFFIGYPIILTVYNVIGIGDTNSECYEDIKTPGFHFFFPSICTDPEAGSTKYAIGSECGSGTDVSMDELASSRCCDTTNEIILPSNVVIQRYKEGAGVIDKFEVTKQSSGECTRSTCSGSTCSSEPSYQLNISTGEITSL